MAAVNPATSTPGANPASPATPDIEYFSYGPAFNDVTPYTGPIYNEGPAAPDSGLSYSLSSVEGEPVFGQVYQGSGSTGSSDGLQNVQAYDASKYSSPELAYLDNLNPQGYSKGLSSAVKSLGIDPKVALNDLQNYAQDNPLNTTGNSLQWLGSPVADVQAMGIGSDDPAFKSKAAGFVDANRDYFNYGQQLTDYQEQASHPRQGPTTTDYITYLASFFGPMFGGYYAAAGEALAGTDVASVAALDAGTGSGVISSGAAGSGSGFASGGVLDTIATDPALTDSAFNAANFSSLGAGAGLSAADKQQLSKLAQKYGQKVAMSVARGEKLEDALKDPNNLYGAAVSGFTPGGAGAAPTGAKMDENDFGVGLPSGTDTMAPPPAFTGDLSNTVPDFASFAPTSTDVGGLPAPDGPVPITGLNSFAPQADAAIPGAPGAVSPGPAPGSITNSGAPGLTAESGNLGRSAGPGGIPVDPNAQNPGDPPAAAGDKGGIGQGMLDKAMGAATKYGPLAMAGIGGVMSQQAAKKASSDLSNVGSTQRNAATSMLQNAQAGVVNPADAAKIAVWVQQAKAAATQYYASAGMSNSSMAQSAMASIDQQAVTMAQTSIQQSLSTAMQELNITDASQIAGIKASMASNQAIAQNLTQFMNAYGAYTRATGAPPAQVAPSTDTIQ